MNEATTLAYQAIINGHHGPVSAKRCVLAIRAASPSERDEVIAMVLAARSEWRQTLQDWQTKWRTKTSRRVQRGNHHDSWTARERYARCVTSNEAERAAFKYAQPIWDHHHGDPFYGRRGA